MPDIQLLKIVCFAVEIQEVKSCRIDSELSMAKWRCLLNPATLLSRWHLIVNKTLTSALTLNYHVYTYNTFYIFPTDIIKRYNKKIVPHLSRPRYQKYYLHHGVSPHRPALMDHRNPLSSTSCQSTIENITQSKKIDSFQSKSLFIQLILVKGSLGEAITN